MPVERRGVAIALAGLTLAKILTFLFLVNAGRLAPFIGDNAIDHYIPAAQRLLAEGRFNGVDSRIDSKVAPGYSAVLAATMAVVPRHFAVITVCLQMVADLLTALCLFWMGTRFLTPAVGALGAAVWLLYPPQVALSTWITAETFFTTALIGSVALGVASLDQRRDKRSLVAGSVLGIATLLRGTTIILPAFLLPVLIRRRAYRWTAYFMAGFILVVAPWAIRNLVVLQDPILVSVGFGGAFLQGADERLFTIAGKRATYPEVYARAADRGIVKPASDHEGKIDNWLFRVGMNSYRERLATEPWSLVPFLLKKALMLWYSTESGGFHGQLMLALSSIPVVIPGLLQLWHWRRQPTWFSTVCGAVVLYFIVLHIATGPLARYMLPVYPLLCLAACDWWVEVLDHRFRSAVAATV